MKLINEQKNISILADFIDYIFNTFLKLAAVFGSCHHSSQIQNTQPSAPDGIRHFSSCDPGCQSFYNGSLAYPRLADQAGIVLGSAA